MADPYVDAKELVAINQEREAKGLPRFRDIAEARAWKASLSEAAVEEGKAEEQKKEEQIQEDEAKPIEEAKPFEAPVIPVAVKSTEQQASASQTDARVKELERELQRIKSEAGRADVVARELREVKAERDAALQKAQEAEERASKLESAKQGGDILSKLTPEQRERMAPEDLEVIAQISRGYAKDAESAALAEAKEVRRMFEERQAREAQRDSEIHKVHIEEMWTRNIAPVVAPEAFTKLATSPKWAEWAAKPYAGSTYGDIYTAAVDSLDHNAVIDLLGKALSYAGIDVPAKGSKPPLKAEAISGGAVTERPKGEEFYEGEYLQRVDDYSKGILPIGWSGDKLRTYLEKAREARDQGRMKAGNRPS